MNPASLQGRRIAVFDLEIKATIESLPGGWKDHDKMGISTLCLYDYSSNRYRVFDDLSSYDALQILDNYDLVVGYNTVRFDWKVVRATWHYPTSPAPARLSKDFDMLRAIWQANGLDPDKFVPATHGGFKLDDVAFETMQMRKCGKGDEAPKLFQQGRLAEVIDYCIEDVRIERSLFEFIVQWGYVVRYGKRIPVKFSL